MPPEPYVSLPGLAFAYWMRLFTSFAGTGPPTTRITGDCASIVTPLKSLIASYGSFLMIAGFW